MNLCSTLKKVISLLLVFVLLMTIPVISAGAIALPEDTVFDSSLTDDLTGYDKGGNNVISGNLYLSESSVSLESGDTFALDAFVSSSVSVLRFTDFSSSAPSVASVNNNGVITAHSKGTAVITAKVQGSGKTARCAVTVTESVVPPTTAPVTQPTSASKPEETTQPTTAADESVTISETAATVYKNCYYQLKASSKAAVTWKSSNTSVATVTSAGIVFAKGAGTATITVSTASKSASCKITVKSGSAVNISNTTKTLYRTQSCLLTSSNSVKWSSQDTSVATVSSKGVVYAQGAGTTVITASTSGGAATCLVTVENARPLRFAYASPNSAAKGSTVSFKAITDTNRTAVKFEVSLNGSKQTVNATEKKADGNTYIWTGYAKLSSAGTYSVTAYAQYKNESKWSTCPDAQTTAFVTNSTNLTAAVNEKRRASDSVIDIIANYEGFLSTLTDDVLTGDPTIGYGKVIYAGDVFYNNLTKNEAYAYLVQTVNESGFSSGVNTYLMNHNAKFNQQQFDALVCFSYNVGSGALSSDDDLAGVFFNSTTLSGSGGSAAVGDACYVSGDYVNLRSSYSTGSSVLTTMRQNTEATLLSTTKYSGSGLSWYYIQLSDGTKGYICSDYLAFYGKGNLYDLSKVNKNDFIYYFLQWHHAGGCVWGLLYRRIDEAEMFLYGDYVRDGSSNKYGFKFTCHSNSSFNIGY